MKLVLLELINFRQHRNTALTFLPGLTGIIGPNGSGKTTILEALVFAMYGARALRGKIDEVTTRGLSHAGEPAVRLIFEHDGQTFRIERKGSDAAIFQGGDATPLASGSRDVALMVSSTIQMSYEEFVATYFTEQKGLEFLSGQKGAAERERFIIRMLGYHRLEKAQELLRTERKETRIDLSAREAALGERVQLEARLEMEQTKVTAAESALAEADQALREAETQAERARKRFLESEARRAAIQKEHASVRELEGRLSERARSDAQWRTEEEQIRAQHADYLREIGVASQSDSRALLHTLEEEIDALVKAQEILHAQVRELEAEWKEKRVDADAALKGMQAQLSERSSRITTLQKLSTEGDCPTCGQSLGEAFHAVCAKEQMTLQDFTLQLEKLREVSEGLRQVPVALEKSQQLLRQHEEQLRLFTVRRTKLTELRGIEERAQELMRKRDSARLETEQLQIQLAKQQSALLAHNFSEEVYLKDKGAHEASQSLVSVARLKRVRLEGDLGALKALEERTRAELIEYDGKRRTLEQRREQLLDLEEADVFLTEFRRHVNGSIRPRLAELASEFIADLTDGRYTAVEVGNDFTPTVLDEGEAKSVLSGGEEDILNLCMRLALSQMLAERAGHSFSLLVLDEVFGSLDEQRRINVLALLEKLSQRFEQILIITHLDDVKEGVRHLWYVDYDESEGISHVNEVGPRLQDDFLGVNDDLPGGEPLALVNG